MNRYRYVEPNQTNPYGSSEVNSSDMNHYRYGQQNEDRVDTKSLQQKFNSTNYSNEYGSPEVNSSSLNRYRYVEPNQTNPYGSSEVNSSNLNRYRYGSLNQNHSLYGPTGDVFNSGVNHYRYKP